MSIEPGDWVRFYQCGRLVIGQVMYKTKDTITGDWELQTDAGCIDAESVLETRKAVSDAE